jgi:GxxExxY protein
VICINVHRKFGPGLLESVYEKAIADELQEKNIPFTRQLGINVIYNGNNLGVGYRADFIINCQVILEIKSIKSINDIHKKQLLTYLKVANLKLGLLINFNVKQLKNGIVRLVNGL